MERPTRGELIIAACGAVLIVTSFLKLWGRYECPTCPPEARWSQVTLWSEAFSVPTKAAVVLVVALLLLILVRLIGVALPWPPGRIYVGAGSLVTLLFVTSVMAGPSDLGFGDTPLLEVSRGPMLLLSWVLALGILYGALRHMRETFVAKRRVGPGPVVLR